MDLYGIAEPACLLCPNHFSAHRAAPPAIEGDLVEYIYRRHVESGVGNMIWELGRSYAVFHTDNPAITPMGSIPAEEGRMDEVPAHERLWLDYFREHCPLQRAMDVAAEMNVPTWGRVAMNRNYSNRSLGGYLTSRFWRDNQERMGEVGKNGVFAGGSLSYFFEEYRDERMEFIRTAAEITGPASGRHVEGVLLDFCRQPPILMYHPEMCAAYEREAGVDPRKISAQDLEPFEAWCRWRAGIMTQFIRRVRSELNEIGERTGQPIRLAARVSDMGPAINLIGGVDIETLCREGLIDVIVTSPLNWIDSVWDHDLRPYVALGREFGVKVIAGVSLLPQTRFTPHPGSVNPWLLARRVSEYQRQGAEGIALYQSETGIEYDVLSDVIPQLGDPATTQELVDNEQFRRDWPITHINSAYGLDCHAWLTKWKIDGPDSQI